MRHTAFVVQPPVYDRRFEQRRNMGCDCLTAFETNILAMLLAGLSRTEIAGKVCRSPQTVSNALTRAKEKLGARSLTHAAFLAARRCNPDRRKSR